VCKATGLLVVLEKEQSLANAGEPGDSTSGAIADDSATYVFLLSEYLFSSDILVASVLERLAHKIPSCKNW
jgi:hypothetical protein